MVIHWSHVVNASQKLKSEVKSRLGFKHKIILSVFYIVLLIALIITVIVYAATGNNVYGFIVIGVAGIGYTIFVVFGFLFYGMKIFVSMIAHDTG